MKLRPTSVGEKIGRILEEKVMPIKDMVNLWTDVFPTLVIWSIEEIRQHLTELFEFSEEESDILIEKYENLLQSKVSPSKEMTSLPNLDKINPDLHPIINTLWEANSFLKRAEKCLDHSELLRYFHESHENFYKSESEKDELYDEAVKLVIREQKASTSFIQRYFRIGYNRAATIIEKMEENNIISKPGRAGKRDIVSEK